MKNCIFHFRLSSSYLLSSLFIIFYTVSERAFSQGKQANNWYMGFHAGLNFNYGSPPQVQSGETFNNFPGCDGVASISDEDGNLLFYSDGIRIWNKDHELMLNGDLMGYYSNQGAMIVPDPGNPDHYYFFNFDRKGNDDFDFVYSIIDMSLDGGKGGVVPDKKKILLLDHISNHLSAVRHNNGNDVWVVVHKFENNTYYSFCVTDNGITNPVPSSVGSNINYCYGYLKISPNGKKIAIAQQANDFCEILDFDTETGYISDENILTIHRECFAIEFSPDNSKIYVKAQGFNFYQYDFEAGNSQAIIDSEVQLATTFLFPGAIQLGPDGKIYCITNYDWMGVIHDPNKKAPDCNYEVNSIFFGDNIGLGEGLPSFIQSYLNDPEFTYTQHCFGQPTQFKIVDINGIDAVEWKFNDPGNAPNDTSNLFAPAYTFSVADTFYVQLKVHSGNLSKTVIDTVIIYPLPTPDLGDDTMYCNNEPISLTLDASPGEQFFWNSDFSPGQPPTFQVSDTGYYKVRVKDHGCSGYDTIHVGRYEEPQMVNPGQANASHCSTADGSITGIVIDAADPYSVAWKDGSGNQVGTDLQLLNVPSGVYDLEITYGNGCLAQFGPYTIQDIGGPEIVNAIPEEDHCNLGTGKITITPAIGNPGDYWYSINGEPFVQNGGVFTGLIADSYTVMIKDQFNCTGSYLNNPVIVANTPGPEFIDIHIIPESSGNGQGSITVYANGSNVTYSIDNNPFQSGNSFSSLSEGDYFIQIIDEFGCTNDTTVHVDNLFSEKLTAMAEGDRKCLKQLANSSIRVSNVSGVIEFTATLTYDGTRLNCIHFNGSLPGVGGTVYPLTSQIVLQWQGSSPIPDNDTIVIGELIFETLQSGFADVNWQSAPATVFKDQFGNIIDPNAIQFYEGIIEVHEIPDASLESLPPLCEGDTISLNPTISGGADPVTYEWTTPQGVSTSSNLKIENAMPGHSGTYFFKVSDRFNCVDTATIDLTITPLPRANFPEINDTIWFNQTFKLEAPQNYYSYEWSNGDTIWYINVTDEGLYSVQLKTEEGCQNLDSVMMMNEYVPISVPNAFTPNGDGLNDTFSPIVDVELVRHFKISIYNQWGQRIFETTNADKVWVGEDAMPGVYSWVINYESRNRKGFQMKGFVTLIR